MKIKHLATFICLGIMSTNSVLGVQAMGKVDPSKVVNGAPAPKKGLEGAADRVVKLAGSAAVVVDHGEVGEVKGAVTGAVVTGVSTAIITKNPQATATAAAVGAVSGGIYGAVEGSKAGVEAAKYPQQ